MSLAALGLLILLVQVAAAAPLYIGVLEGPQIGGHGQSISAQTHVRIVFAKDGASWKAMPDDFGMPSKLATAHLAYPDAVDWTVLFDGRALGRLASRNPGPLHWYADIGTHILTTKSPPKIRTGADDFLYATGMKAKTRPLLLVSAGIDSKQWDPDGWKPSPLSADEIRLAVAAFRGKVATSERCDAPEQEPIHRVAYRDDEVFIIKSYRAKAGAVLFGARLNDPGENCGWFDDETLYSYWFVIDRKQQVHFLDSQMVPVDAADLDNSGHSAWVFFTSRHEDDEGYELFYDDFRKKMQFTWSYH